MRIGIALLAGAILAVGQRAAVAQRPLDIVKWTAAVSHATHASATVTLSATVEKGWHVYAVSQTAGGPTPLKISLPDDSAYALAGPVPEAKPIHHFDPAFKMETVYYLDTVKLAVPLKKTGAGAEPKEIAINVRFQACNDSLCLPPYTAHLTAVPAK